MLCPLCYVKVILYKNNKEKKTHTHTRIYSHLYTGCFNIHGIHATPNNSTHSNVEFFFVADSKIKVELATVVEGDPKVPYSIASTLYTWPLPYKAEC